MTYLDPISSDFTAQNSTYPAIITIPPIGVNGPNTFPTFSLANTSPKTVPENVSAPPRIIPAAYRYRLIPDTMPGWYEMARRAIPL